MSSDVKVYAAYDPTKNFFSFGNEKLLGFSCEKFYSYDDVRKEHSLYFQVTSKSLLKFKKGDNNSLRIVLNAGEEQFTLLEREVEVLSFSCPEIGGEVPTVIVKLADLW